MKSIIVISLTLLTLINTHVSNETQHTFLVKTDLTKEQVETLLNQYHHKQGQNQTQTLLKQQNSTTLKQENSTTLVKKEENQDTTQLKKQKEPKTPEAPEAQETETVNLKKKEIKKNPNLQKHKKLQYLKKLKQLI